TCEGGDIKPPSTAIAESEWKRATSEEWAAIARNTDNRLQGRRSVTTERRARRTRRQRHSYSAEVADLICERMAADGLALRQICQDTTMPARWTLFVWLRRRGVFGEKYTFAKGFKCQSWADDMVDIADSRANDLVERGRPDGKKVRVFDPESSR